MADPAYRITGPAADAAEAVIDAARELVENFGGAPQWRHELEAEIKDAVKVLQQLEIALSIDEAKGQHSDG